jgi:hypothetical protein
MIDGFDANGSRFASMLTGSFRPKSSDVCTRTILYGSPDVLLAACAKHRRVVALQSWTR